MEFAHAQEAVFTYVLIAANLLIGLPFMLSAWLLGWVTPAKPDDSNLNRAKLLLTCSVVLNTVWIFQMFTSQSTAHLEFVRWITDSSREMLGMLLGFLFLIASTVDGRRKHAPGRVPLLIAQYSLLLLSSISWVMIAADL
ncbi:MAG TPA: hypothetical protein VFC39_03055 [Acidobacteriaceae bacterium]|nr:hypothetical protein [Acidobacteriaceae bacterium]